MAFDAEGDRWRSSQKERNKTSGERIAKERVLRVPLGTPPNPPTRAFLSALQAVEDFSKEAAPELPDPFAMTVAMLARAFETLARSDDADYPDDVKAWLLRLALNFSFAVKTPPEED